MNNDLSWSAAREARIDRAIDRAVREMMQVDPPPGLRRRVLARLDAPERRNYFLPRYAVAVMALVLFIAASISMLRDRVEPPTPPNAPQIATMSGVVPLPVIRPEQTSTEETPSHVTRQQIRMPRVTNVFGNRSGEVSAATTETGKREIVARPLTIVPLSARPIVVEPLAIPAARKGGQ